MLYLVVAMWLLVSTSCVCANKPCFVCLLNILPFRQNIFRSKLSSSELVVHISSFVDIVEFCYELVMEFFLLQIMEVCWDIHETIGPIKYCILFRMRYMFLKL